MSAIEFQAWPKIPRLRRPITITEKIDGTNAAIIIEPVWNDVGMPGPLLTSGDVIEKGRWILQNTGAFALARTQDGKVFVLAAQSRKRLIAPGDDNFGFAHWVGLDPISLVEALGPGRHFGEWWGSGIQRGYGLPEGEKRFSLFNTDRYADVDTVIGGVPVKPVPILLRRDTFNSTSIDFAVDRLRVGGSVAAPGYRNPEGVIVFHHASQHVFKRLVEGDDVPKGQES